MTNKNKNISQFVLMFRTPIWLKLIITSFSEDALAPDLHSAAALAAYGAAAYASGGFGGSTAASGTTGSAGAPNYASYYNNYMAFYPHTANPSPGYTGYGSGSAGTAPQLPTHPSSTGNQAIYHLNNALPPPSISEPGINSLDDIVNNKPGKKIKFSLLR